MYVCMYVCILVHTHTNLQQAAMGAVDMGMAMRQAAVGGLAVAAAGAEGVGVQREAVVGSFFTCPFFLCVSLSIESFSLTPTFSRSQNLVSLTLTFPFALFLAFSLSISFSLSPLLSLSLSLSISHSKTPPVTLPSLPKNLHGIGPYDSDIHVQ